jgi:type III restriction enzyme
VEPDWLRPFVFEPGRYAVHAGSRYQGRWKFERHYYPVIADLKAQGEEFDCAVGIDRHPDVRHWVRNLDSEPFGFWLPTSRGRFCPDFIVERNDGVVAVIEYKGALLRDNQYEIEKRQVGELWAKRSAGKCRFAFVYLNQGGRSMQQQLDQVLAV